MEEEEEEEEERMKDGFKVLPKQVGFGYLILYCVVCL